MNKLTSKVGLSLLIGLCLTTPLNILKPGRAAAWTGAIKACSVNFGSFNWKDAIKNSPANTQHYEVDASSTIAIYQYAGIANGHFVVDMVPSPYKAFTTQGPPDAITGLTPKSFTHAISSGTSNMGTEWDVDSVNKTVINNGTVAVDPAQNKIGTEGTGNSGDVTCIQTLKGYALAYNWDQVALPEAIPEQGAVKCSGALDFGCWIGRAFNGIENTFAAVGQAILKGLTWLWAPDGTKTKAEFDGLQSFLTTKLGFLTYPFTYMNSLFTAFGDQTNNWCTATDCSRSFGNFFGQNVTLHFDQAKTTIPGVWNYMLLFIRGVFVLGIFFAVLRKYREVTQR